MTTAATAVKRVGEWALANSILMGVARQRRRGSLLILAYHNIVPDGGDGSRGDASLHLADGRFRRQLDLLAASHEIVALSDLLRGSLPPTRRPRAVITFDDAYSGALTLGLAALEERRIPATFFIAPAFVQRGEFWWDALAASSGGTMPSAVRDHALVACRGVDTDVRRWAANQGFPMPAVPAVQRCASIRELFMAARIPGISFGAHSWSHPVLSALPPEALQVELERPLRWLREGLGEVTVPALAVPYGLSSPQVETAARQAGYAAIFTGVSGWVRAADELPFVLPRRNVPSGLSGSGFALRASGARR